MTHQLITSAAFKAAANQKENLYKNIWKESTTALLHSSRSVDKTTLALDIAESLVARGKQTVYVNTSHNLEDHIDRLSSNSDLLIFTPAYDSPDDATDYADLVISGIEEIIATTSVRTFIIDSVSRIAGLSFGRNASAAYVMKRLVALQVRHGLSLLILSHDSTKSADRALINLADCEITVSSETDDEPKPEAKATESECIEQPELPQPVKVVETQSRPAHRFSYSIYNVDTTPSLNRRQRRELERQQRKLAGRQRKS